MIGQACHIVINPSKRQNRHVRERFDDNTRNNNKAVSNYSAEKFSFPKEIPAPKFRNDNDNEDENSEKKITLFSAADKNDENNNEKKIPLFSPADENDKNDEKNSDSENMNENNENMVEMLDNILAKFSDEKITFSSEKKPKRKSSHVRKVRRPPVHFETDDDLESFKSDDKIN